MSNKYRGYTSYTQTPENEYVVKGHDSHSFVFFLSQVVVVDSAHCLRRDVGGFIAFWFPRFINQKNDLVSCEESILW